MKRPSLMAKPSTSDELCVRREHLAVENHEVGGLRGGVGDDADCQSDAGEECKADDGR